MQIRKRSIIDPACFMEQSDQYMDRMYKTAWAILKNETDVADAIQESITDGYEKRKTLRQPEYFGTWMLRILINNCYQILRQYRKETYGEIPETGAEDSYLEDDGFKQLIRYVDEKYQLVLTLYYADECTVKEIAELLQMKENTVKTWLARGREQVRRYLDA